MRPVYGRLVRLSLIAVTVWLSAPARAAAQTFTATDDASLRNAISLAAASGGTVQMLNNITLTSDLPNISTPGSITFDGGGFTLSGNNQYRGLYIGGISDGGATSVAVTVQNLTIANTVATGGNGGNGNTGGGGG